MMRWDQGLSEELDQGWTTTLGSVETERGVVTEETFDFMQEALAILCLHIIGRKIVRYPLRDILLGSFSNVVIASSGAPAAGHSVRHYVSAELDRLRELSAGWDGYSAQPIDPEIIEAARTLIFQLPQTIAPRPRVVPLASGALQFEWGDNDVALELEFESPTTIRFLKWHPAGGDPEEDTISVSDQRGIENLIRWFTQQNV